MVRSFDPSRRVHGLTLVEISLASSMILTVVGVSSQALLETQRGVLAGQELAELQLRARNALDRLVELTAQAISTDPVYGTIAPATGANARGLEFRLADSVSGGTVTWNDAQRVIIYGPTTSIPENRALLVGRAASVAEMRSVASGGDGVLGTTDDDYDVSIAGGIPILELLIPEEFAPQTGSMLTVDLDPAPTGTTVRFTLRLNARDRNGTPLLDTDLVLTERVALRR